MELLFENTDTLKNYLNNLLASTTIDVEFTKLDGSERLMSCTKDPRILPKMNESAEKVDDHQIQKVKAQRKTNPGVIVVYDTEISAWRSITLSRIKRITTGKFSMDIVVEGEAAL